MAKKYTKQKNGYFTTTVWDGTYKEDGSKHYKTIRSKVSSKDLERKVEAFQKSIDTNVSFNNITLSEYAQHWMETSKYNREIKTKAMYENILDKHINAIGGVRLADLKHSHIQNLINATADRPRTCEQIQMTIKQIVKFAIRDDILPESAVSKICDDIVLPKRIKKPKRPLTEIEKQAVLSVQMDGRKTAFLYLIYGCGLRRGEALALTKNDIDFKAGEISINKAVIFDKEKSIIKPHPKTDNSIRVVPIEKSLLNKISPFIRFSNGQIFKNANGNPITKSGYDKMWRSIVNNLNKAAGYTGVGEKPIQDLTAHIFRHNYCTELCYKIPQISTKKIAALMGDTEKMVLEVYSHIVEEKEDIRSVIDEVFSL